jgi:hypothetical protein
MFKETVPVCIENHSKTTNANAKETILFTKAAVT